MRTGFSALVGLAAAAALVVGAPAHAAEKVTVATVGSASANLWPVIIGMKKGFFTEQDLAIDLVYVQSSAQTVQQLTAGSIDITMSTGLVDPIRAIEKGAPISVLRFESQSPPYVLVSKGSIKSMKDLKGKVISLGGPKDITKIYVERMLAPSGVKPGEFDMVFAGATSARASALLGGAVDAAILLPPFNFQAAAAGFNELGHTVDYAKDLPFSGTIVNNNWANAHKATLAKLLAAHNKSVAWFYDEKNRAEAVKMLLDVSGLKPDDVEKSYDFFRKGQYFEPTGKVSKAKLQALVSALETLGDLPAKYDINKLVLPGVTQMGD